MSNYKDITGQKFGRWTVLYKTDKRSASGGIIWHCICSCPEHNEKDVIGLSLRRGASKSCGCLQREIAAKNAKETKWKDITNQQFGFLTALYPTEERASDGSIKWKCKCHNCGKTKNISIKDLQSKDTISCGCFKSSKGELKISNILKKLNIINYETQKKFNNCKNPKTNGYLRFDFYLPDYNCCIEYDGEQHFIANDKGWFTEDKVKEIQYRDNIKNEYCKNNNIKLIRIPYWDYNKLDNNYILEFLNNL